MLVKNNSLKFYFVIFISSVFSGATLALDYEGKIKLKRAIYKNISSSVELRMATDFNAILYRHIDIGAQAEFREDWKIATHYRRVDRRPDTNQWQREARFYLQAERLFSNIDSKALTFLNLKIRNRIESRARENKEHAYRHRLRFKLKSKNMLYGEIKPFVSNEFYYDLQKHEYNVNRFDIGVDLGEIRSLKHSLYLKLKSKRKNNHWATEASLVYKLEI